MARDETVWYTCDVCGRRSKAQNVTIGNSDANVRPPGWGAASAVVQGNSLDREKEKWDFCSRACAEKRWNELMEDSYS